MGGVLDFENILLLAKKIEKYIFETPGMSISKLVSAFFISSLFFSALSPLTASYLLVQLQMNVDKILGDIFWPTPTTPPPPAVPSLLIHSAALEQKRSLADGSFGFQKCQRFLCFSFFAHRGRVAKLQSHDT